MNVLQSPLAISDNSGLLETSLLEITEGMPNLGVTSYWTDAEGNVVFGPDTPKEKMGTPVTGTKKQKRKETVTETPPVEKVDGEEDIQGLRDEEQVAVETAAEPEASDSDLREDAEEEGAGRPLTSDQSESAERPADVPAEEEPPPLAETDGNAE